MLAVVRREEDDSRTAGPLHSIEHLAEASVEVGDLFEIERSAECSRALSLLRTDSKAIFDLLEQTVPCAELRLESIGLGERQASGATAIERRGCCVWPMRVHVVQEEEVGLGLFEELVEERQRAAVGQFATATVGGKGNGAVGTLLGPHEGAVQERHQPTLLLEQRAPGSCQKVVC